MGIKGPAIMIAAVILLLSVIYYVIFTRKQEKFIKHWSWAWAVYALGVLSFVLHIYTGADFYLGLRKVADMYNILFLLCGTYSFVHAKVPGYWYRFSIYMVMLVALCMGYHTELLTLYLPIAILQIIISIFIGFTVFTKWKNLTYVGITNAIVLMFWGIAKAVASIVEIYLDMDMDFLFLELICANVVNICLLTLYSRHSFENRALRSNLYEKVIENAQDTLFYYNLEPFQTYEYISPSCVQLTGYTQDEFYANPNRMLQLMTERNMDTISLFGNGGEELPEKGGRTFEITRRNNENIWIEMKWNLVREKGEAVAVEGVFRDVTELQTASMEQIRATRSRNMLFSYISHELRTPITSVAGYITAMEDGTFSTEKEKQEAMDVISAKTMTIKKLIDELDQMLKLETNQFSFDFQVYNVGMVTEVLIANSMGDIEKLNFTAEVSYDEKKLGSYDFVIDLERINQVYTNLVTNALKYSPAGDKIWIGFAIDAKEEHFICSVRDEGIGIGGSDQLHIFDPFFRAENNRKADKYTEGRGLGLSICKEIINRHNGEIYVESEYGKGSTFTFIIPLFKED